MIRLRFLLPALLAFLSVDSISDAVLWDYDLTELPPGWEINFGEWTFEMDGAHAYASATPGELDWEEMESEVLVLPPGTDSISISLPQASSAFNGGAGTFCFARIYGFVNSGSNIWWNNSSGVDSTPIFLVPDTVAAGDSLWLLFVVAAADNNSESRTALRDTWAQWHIWDLVLTAYGDITELQPSSWAGVKALD